MNDRRGGYFGLRDEIERGSVTSSAKGHPGPITVEIFRTKTNYIIQMRKGHPQITIVIRPEVDVHENNSDLGLSNPQNVKLVEKVFSDSIRQTVENMLDLLQHRYDADIASLGELVHDSYPQEWNQFENNWSQEFAKIPVEVDVQGKIRRVGMTGQTLSRQDDEVSR